MAFCRLDLLASLVILLQLAGQTAVASQMDLGALPTWQSQLDSLKFEFQQSSKQQIQPHFCVVVRTYWGHGGNTTYQRRQGLRQLVRSLQAQSVGSWEAVVVVMDSKPFPDLHHIIQDLEDDRVWVFAEWVSQEFTPRINGQWTADYHGRLYNLTDTAMRACSSNTDWVLATNGDNQYANNFFEQVLQANGSDIVAFDYYSRYQRVTGRPCERFGVAEGAHACKRNKLRWCHTDLGANVLSWPRLVAEDRRFGTLGVDGGGLAAEHFDGVMVQSLIAANWTVHHVHDCLYDHSPSIQRCARLEGVWDDSAGLQGDVGGRCLTPWQASRRMKDDAGALEQVTVRITRDDQLTRFGNEDPTEIQCIRQQNVNENHLQLMGYFGERCADEVDAKDFESEVFKAAVAFWEQQRREEEERRQAEAAAVKAPVPPTNSPGSPGGRKRDRFVS